MNENVRAAVIAELEPYVSRLPCMHATIDIVEHLERYGIEGDFVECGVFRGGHMLLAKAYARHADLPERRYWLFDTFEGMPKAGQFDVKHNGKHAGGQARRRGPGWCRASLDEVKQNFRELLDDSVTFVKGAVEDTLVTGSLPEKIAYLRLDTDFYASTKIELEVLYPRLVPGGVLVVDDYGFWQGCRRAVDEYFGFAPDFQVIDFPARMLTKSA